MNRRRLLMLLPLALFLAVAAFLAVGLQRDPRELPSPLIGKQAPPFQAPRLGAPGGTFAPRDMEGKVWLLNVWASWCTSCRIEHPMLMRFARQGIAPVVGLNYKDKADAGLQWLRLHGDPYALSVFDPEGRIGIDYGVYGVPETFVIDGRGAIRFRHAGPLTQDVLDRRIAPLIKELNGA
ncbi:DsbE family thiol:disulfide interchange protein [Pseudoduganella sp. SL102]|uniref:DsbE family thiol:disulfide interchange protein n=1 Tax=Pseudoduganella sp. SL102 TaxID=2995154 RepID=UPI00248BD3D8|nr:DsbE family thiol:disulfide interchange protein [Pseudoduganella sp. SL102]WBS00977.1 DsbE family thiol:disulfide interchange protein [Pseudoduganella sp. SL102]